MNLLCWSMAPSSRVTRKWEVFAGRNKFYCDGYFMSAPHTGVFYFTVFLITFTSTLFFAFDCPYLAVRITLAIPIIGGCLFVFTMGALLRTTFTDPGVIPRASQDEAAYIEKQIEVPNSLNSPTFRPPPRTKEVLVKGQTVKLKYCFTCKIFRPPRASHCSLCDNCVDRFDHHCPWVGNCVGKRNYRFFYMFIVSLAFLALFIFACSVTHLILLAKDNDKQEFVDVIRQAPFSLVSAFICFLSIWSVIGLAGFHTYLTTSDQTTNEDIKGSFSSKGGANSVNPYSHGNICLNCFYILCGPMTPSLIDRRGIVTDEYRIQMQQNERYQAPMLHVPVTAQPLTAGEQLTKANFYDIEGGPPTLLNNGVYRQRSYENLQNGQSTSNAHLVDNELLPSSVSSPVVEAIDHNGASPGRTLSTTDDAVIVASSAAVVVIPGESPTTVERSMNVDGAVVGNSNSNTNDDNDDNDDDDDDDACTENLSNRNNLSGSYSNLYRGDKLDSDDLETDIVESSRLPQLGRLSHNSRGIDLIANAVVAAAAPNARENVYSNVPFTTCDAANATAAAAAAPIANDDPSSHVYSNIASPTLTGSVAAVVADSVAVVPSVRAAKRPSQHHQRNHRQSPDFDFGDISAILHSDASMTTTTTTEQHLDVGSRSPQSPATAVSGADSLASHRRKSTLMMVDDLDLDDPVTAASAFAMSLKKSKTAAPGDATLAGVNGGGASIEMKNVLGQQVEPNASVAAANTFCSPSRMRLLHDTTMIDTALDLDSLDGSSLGNASHACLVSKTTAALV